MRRRPPASDFEPGELNLVPYLDIMVNLLMFLLVTTAVAAELRVVPTEPPGSGDGNLVSVALFVGHDKVVVRDADSAAEFPRSLAWDAVTAELEAIHARQGDAVVAIAAEPDVSYDDVIAAIDAARETRGGNKLYPKFTLGEAR